MKNVMLSTFVALIALRLLIAAASPVFDTSEARYAAISANMSRTGDFVVPRFTYNNRYQSFDGKPPLLFQSAGLCHRVISPADLAVRVPVLLFTAAMLALMFFAIRRTASARRALLACGIAMTAVAYYAQTGLCMPDGMLAACVASAYLCHYLLLLTKQRNWSLGVFVALALGMLTKGPVAIVLFAGPVLLDTIANRRWQALKGYRWFCGGAIFLAIAAPWFCLMQQRTPGFLRYFFVNENLLRFLVHEYGDRYGSGRETFRGMALVWALVVTLPWSPLLAWRQFKSGEHPSHWWRRITDGTPKNVFVWGMIGIVGFWCLTSRVPMPYLMPIVPLFAAFFAMSVRIATARWLARIFPAAAAIAVAVCIGSLVVGRLTGDKLDGAAAPYRLNHYSFEFYHGTPDFAKEAR